MPNVSYLHSRAVFVCILLSLGAGQAWGQAEIIPEDDFQGAADTDIDGWNPSLAVSGTLNLVSNTNAVGQVEGLSMLLGMGLAGGADYIRGPLVVRNELVIAESLARTPVVDQFLKTNDRVSLATTANYFLTKYFGGFGRLKLSTSIFNARAITADPTDYVITSAGEAGETRNRTSSKLKVSSSFKPFTINESLGGFARPLSNKKLSISLRAGIGGRHTFASGVLVEDDDDDTPTIELQELTDVHQAGLELFAGLEGKAKKNRVSYSAGASVLLPFINNDIFDRSATDLTRLGFEVSATVAVFDWMGLVYKGSIIIDPQLFPEGKELNQYQTSLLLTFQYTLIDREKGIKELQKEAALERAKKDKEEAERRVLAAEQEAERLKLELEEAQKQRELEEAARQRELEEAQQQDVQEPPVEVETPTPDPNAVPTPAF